jgi:ecotin
MKVRQTLVWLSVLALGAAALGAAGTGAANPNNMKAFPPADAGMVRYVLQLPQEADEAAFKVELIAGKTVLVDGVNHYFFGGTIEEQTIQGWGFPRYNVSPLGPMAGTLIGVDPGAPKVNRFVPLAGEPFLIRYNSKLPVVVYAPEGVEVRYRIWKAAPQPTTMEKG